MTDNDIIKALERCIQCNQMHISNCNGCLFEETYPDCDAEIEIKCLDLINRLKAENEEQDQAILNALHHMKVVRTEAYKEFAERLHEKLYTIPTIYNSHFGRMVYDLLKELMEGDNEKR